MDVLSGGMLCAAASENTQVNPWTYLTVTENTR
jgi:hypothetical protein